MRGRFGGSGGRGIEVLLVVVEWFMVISVLGVVNFIGVGSISEVGFGSFFGFFGIKGLGQHSLVFCYRLIQIALNCYFDY